MIISLVINLLKLANTCKLILNLHDSKSVIIKLEPANIFGWCYCIFCLRNVFKNRSIVKLVADQFSVFATSQIKLSRRDFHCFHVIQTTRETLQTSCSLLSKARPIVKFWTACFAQYMIYSINLDLEKQRFCFSSYSWAKWSCWSNNHPVHLGCILGNKAKQFWITIHLNGTYTATMCNEKPRCRGAVFPVKDKWSPTLPGPLKLLIAQTLCL